jgi:dTMP kinase
MDFYYTKSIQKKGPFMNTKHLLLLALCTITPFTTHTMENNKQLNKGILVAIEGIDGSGKTTLAQSVNTTLTQRGFDTVLTKEPGDSALGKQIREIVQTQTMPIAEKAEFLLFAADRAQHFEELIFPAFEKNKLIISDRLADSSIAYQGYGRGLYLKALKTMNNWAMWGLHPHITFFVRVPVDVALERCKKRSSLSAFEQKEFLERVACGFEELYKDRTDIIVIDGTESPESMSEYVCKAIERWIEEKQLLSQKNS